ncbi:MAG: S1 RNA-binding domain-containing protein, partial [Desulfonatronovibrionaceae bacterium]
IFIGIEEGIDGLIHVSDLSWTKKIRHPSEMYNVGDMIQAKVLTVDKENEKFTLGIKQLTEDPWLEVPNRYPTGTVVNGRITNITDFGLFVEVEEGIEGLVHVSELSRKKVKNPKENFEEGQEIQAKVIHVSADERRLGLSVKDYLDEMEKEHSEDSKGTKAGAQQTPGSNLGDLIRRKLEEDGEEES